MFLNTIYLQLCQVSDQWYNLIQNTILFFSPKSLLAQFFSQRNLQVGAKINTIRWKEIWHHSRRTWGLWAALPGCDLVEQREPELSIDSPTGHFVTFDPMEVQSTRGQTPREACLSSSSMSRCRSRADLFTENHWDSCLFTGFECITRALLPRVEKCWQESCQHF